LDGSDFFKDVTRLSFPIYSNHANGGARARPALYVHSTLCNIAVTYYRPDIDSDFLFNRPVFMEGNNGLLFVWFVPCNGIQGNFMYQIQRD
jgi:hypothetical protein